MTQEDWQSTEWSILKTLHSLIPVKVDALFMWLHQLHLGLLQGPQLSLMPEWLSGVFFSRWYSQVYLEDFWVVYNMEPKVVREKYGPIFLSIEESASVCLLLQQWAWCGGCMSLLGECDLWFPFPWCVNYLLCWREYFSHSCQDFFSLVAAHDKKIGIFHYPLLKNVCWWANPPKP